MISKLLWFLMIRFSLSVQVTDQSGLSAVLKQWTVLELLLVNKSIKWLKVKTRLGDYKSEITIIVLLYNLMLKEILSP